MLTLIAILFVFLLAGCAVANRFYVPPAIETAPILNGQQAIQDLPNGLTLTTWNIGYAGMGKESDFVFDLGEQRRPLSGALVDKNLTAIMAHLKSMDSDVYLLQEAARPSWLNYRRNVLEGIIDSLQGYAYIFGPDINIRFIPPPFDVEVGNAIFSRVRTASAEWRALPLEPTFEFGFFRKGYRMHIVRIEGSRQWVIVNVHLSTFDSAEDDVRRKQVVALMEFAQAEFAKGNHVIIGGDWNLRLVDNYFPNTTADKFKFWIRDFPHELVPENWRWAVDETVPTVRTAHQPYVPGANYVLNIDGFLVSPNVLIEHVEGSDLNFEFTDHHPVTARFTALD